jgi:phage terminase large subunit
MSAAMVRSIMIGRLRQFGKRGYEWRTTTPRGRNHIWQTFVRDNQNNPDYFLIQATSADNVFLDRSIIEDWEREYVGDFADQELGGEFVAFSGLIYSEFDRRLHVTTKRPDTWTYAEAGVDWGFSHAGVITVGLMDGDGRMHIVQQEYAKQRLIEDWVEVGKQLKETWGIRKFHCDPSEPDYIKKFRGAGLNAVEAINSVLPGIQAVKARLVRRADGRPRLTYDASCVHSFDEYDMYQWSEDRYGMKDAPLKVHDDTKDSERYLIMGVDKPARQYRQAAYRSSI